jgi:hypothetical protein
MDYLRSKGKALQENKLRSLVSIGVGIKQLLRLPGVSIP